MTTNRWYALGAAVLVGVLLIEVRAGAEADRNAAVWEGRALVADSLRVAAEARARADSVALEAARSAYVQDTIRLSHERTQAALRATRAAQIGQEAANRLRASLDVQQAVLLDSLESSHAQEIEAKDQQIAQADSATAVERSLRVATEQALASERLAHQAANAQIGAMEVQIEALKRSKQRDEIQKWGERVAFVTTLVLTH